MKRKNTYISLFHLLVFCLASLPGALLHSHHSHSEQAELSSCQLHIEYEHLNPVGQCEHGEHFTESRDACFACIFHYNPMGSDEKASFFQLRPAETLFYLPYHTQLYNAELLLAANRGPPASV